MKQKFLIDKKIYNILIISLIIVFSFFTFLTIKSYNNKSIEEIKINKSNRESFSVMVQNNDGKYQKYESDTLYPDGYAYNPVKSYCEDINGDKVTGVLTTNNSSFTVTSDVTVYCYLYFDISFASKLINNNELWQSNLEGDGYRYIGSGAYDSETTPNNFVCFGTTSSEECKANELKYMYRIIGVFPDNDGKQHLKLIKFKQLEETYAWVSDAKTEVSWSGSALNTGLNTEYFKTNTNYNYMQDTTWLNKIEDWQWQNVLTRVYGVDSNNSTSSDNGPSYLRITSEQMYLHERNKQNLLNSHTCVSGNTTNSTCSWSLALWDTSTGKIGLIYGSDYMLALGSSALNYTCIANSATLNTGWIHQSNNDTSKSIHEWTVDSDGLNSSGNMRAWGLYSTQGVGTIVATGKYGVRPVFYLKSNVVTISGSGTYNDPYIIN